MVRQRRPWTTRHTQWPVAQVANIDPVEAEDWKSSRVRARRPAIRTGMDFLEAAIAQHLPMRTLTPIVEVARNHDRRTLRNPVCDKFQQALDLLNPVGLA